MDSRKCLFGPHAASGLYIMQSRHKMKMISTRILLKCAMEDIFDKHHCSASFDDRDFNKPESASAQTTLAHSQVVI